MIVSAPDRGGKIRIIALVAILLIGIFLRLPPTLFNTPALRAVAWLHPQPKRIELGVDENLYRGYVDDLRRVGFAAYPDIVDNYIERQKTLSAAILPPVRFLYIFFAYTWQTLFGNDALSALRNVSALFSVFTLLFSVWLGRRLKGPGYVISIAALMSFAPTQLHMSQYALIDGFFGFWTLLMLWLLWENLRSPRVSWWWIVLYAFSLAALVLTKENLFFVWLAILAILVANRWLQIGSVTRELFYATLLGPLIGVVILAWLSGGVSTLIATYQLFITKNYTFKYSILYQDGPWHRYLVDLLLVSPVILLLAIGSIFTLTYEKKVEWFFVIFIIASYAPMAGIRYGMNLRFANMWDLPLRILALSQLISLSGCLPKWRNAVVVAAIFMICVTEFRNYLVLAVDYPLYDLVSQNLFRALHILKSP